MFPSLLCLLTLRLTSHQLIEHFVRQPLAAPGNCWIMASKQGGVGLPRFDSSETLASANCPLAHTPILPFSLAGRSQPVCLLGQLLCLLCSCPKGATTAGAVTCWGQSVTAGGVLRT